MTRGCVGAGDIPAPRAQGGAHGGDTQSNNRANRVVEGPCSSCSRIIVWACHHSMCYSNEIDRPSPRIALLGSCLLKTSCGERISSWSYTGIRTLFPILTLTDHLSKRPVIVGLCFRFLSHDLECCPTGRRSRKHNVDLRIDETEGGQVSTMVLGMTIYGRSRDAVQVKDTYLLPGHKVMLAPAPRDASFEPRQPRATTFLWQDGKIRYTLGEADSVVRYRL